MARPIYKDERRILEALRHLRTGTVGKLPTREVLIDAFLGTSSNNPELSERFRGVLRSEKKLSFAVLDRCLSKVNKEYEQNRVFLRNDLLSTSALDRRALKPATIRPPDYENESSLISDESVEMQQLNLIHTAVFGKELTEVGVTLLRRLTRSLAGLDPVAKVFLIAEFEVRETLRLEQQSHPDAYEMSAESINKLCLGRDIELLLAIRPWTQVQEFSLPWDFLAELSGSNIYTPLVRFMEPLDQPEWEPVLNWYSLALYSSQSSLEANRKNLKLELRLGVDLPIRWETILQLAEKYWKEKEI